MYNYPGRLLHYFLCELTCSYRCWVSLLIFVTGNTPFGRPPAFGGFPGQNAPPGAAIPPGMGKYRQDLLQDSAKKV